MNGAESVSRVHNRNRFLSSADSGHNLDRLHLCT